MAYWSNPLKYKSVHPPPGTLDELRVLGGQEALINQSAPRSHSNSPTPLTSQVSHIRTQPTHSHHAAMQNYMSGSYNDLSASGSSPVSYQGFSGPSSVDDAISFADIDGGFLPTNVPTYEQIMQTSTSSFSSGRTQVFPNPDHGFHPAGFGAGSGEYDQGGYSTRGQQIDAMDSTPGPNCAFSSGQSSNIWDSFVGDLVSGGSPSPYNGVPFSI